MVKTAPPAQRSTAAMVKEKRILESALFLFSQRGFHGTAVPEVAKHAEVGAGTIYRYFENKEDLVNAVFRHSKNKLKQYLLNGVRVSTELREVFHQFWGQLVRFAQENPTDFHFLELQDHAPYLDQTSKQLELEVLTPIWMFCVQGRKQGVVRDMPEEALIAMIWGAFVGLMKAQTLGYISINEETLKQAEETCWDMLTKA